MFTSGEDFPHPGTYLHHFVLHHLFCANIILCIMIISLIYFSMLPYTFCPINYRPTSNIYQYRYTNIISFSQYQYCYLLSVSALVISVYSIRGCSLITSSFFYLLRPPPASCHLMSSSAYQMVSFVNEIHASNNLY